jgi:D-serine deaminase-like pyridoxal phosphate-dependent protein
MRGYARPVSGDVLYARYERAFGNLEPPFAFVDLDALERNARELAAMAAGKPIRVATKSVRSVSILRRVLALDPSFGRLLTFTLQESLWLAGQGFEDIVCAYPTTDRPGITALADLTGAEPDSAPALMVAST